MLLPRITARTIFAGSSSFLARCGLIHDLDGDGVLDLFVPIAGGLAVYLATAGGLGTSPAALVEPPPEEPEESGPSAAEGDLSEEDEARHVLRFGAAAMREVLLPEPVDLNGDGLPDLLYRAAGERNRLRVRLGLGSGRFGAAFDPLPGWSPSADAPAARTNDEEEPPSREVAWLGDLDGDGLAEVVTSQELPSGKDSMRAELAEAKRPHARIRVHALGPDGRWDPAPKAEFTVEGYVFEGGGSDDGASGEGGGFSSRRGCAISMATASSIWSP